MLDPVFPHRISHGVGLAGLGVAGGDVKPSLTKAIGAPNAFLFLSRITSVSSAYSSPGGLCPFNTVIDCFDGRRCGHANASEHVGGNKQ